MQRTMERIPASAVVPRKSNKTRFMVGGALVIIAIVALIANGIRTGGNYYLTLDELAAKSTEMAGHGVRVNATVDKESVVYNAQAITLSFDLVDPVSGVRRSVVYNDPMPDLFMKSESVIVEGTLASNGTLDASTILVKCPSKYEEAQQEGYTIPKDHYENLETSLNAQ